MVVKGPNPAPLFPTRSQMEQQWGLSLSCTMVVLSPRAWLRVAPREKVSPSGPDTLICPRSTVGLESTLG